jgi:hypothetical protein
MSMADAFVWLRAHPPAGLKRTFWRGGSAYGIAGYGYEEPDTDAWSNAELAITVAAVKHGTGTEWRADGIALWLDPTPIRDQYVGKRIRLTIAGGCPGSHADIGGVINSGSDLDRTLLPQAQPTAVLICDYAGQKPQRGTQQYALTAYKLRPAADARHLAGVVRGIRLSHLDGGYGSSPPGEGTATIFVFAFPGRADVGLLYRNSGSQSITNGKILAGEEGLMHADLLLHTEVHRLTR